MVERTIYMNKIKKLHDQQIIKVIMGVCRCGKSTLLKQFQSYLLDSGVDQKQIIAFNFEDVENERLLDYHVLHFYATKRLVPSNMTCRFLLLLKRIRDNYPKYIITMDEMPMDEDGIKIVDVLDFFLQ